MHPTTQMQIADDELFAACLPLIESAEAMPALLSGIEPEVLALLTLASKAGKCSRAAIYRLDARLKLARRIAFGLAGLAPMTPRLG